MRFEIVRYSAERANEWNAFVAKSKNGTFLFDRSYMDYHADRFEDFSLMFYYDGKLYALLPANKNGNTLESHMGLTYGGLITDRRATAAMIVWLFKEMNCYLSAQGFTKVIYKRVPWIYHQMPADEDLYAMFRTCKAQLIMRDIASTIIQPNPIRWERVRRRALTRSFIENLQVEKSTDYAGFWQVLNQNLEDKYGVKAVHSIAEIELLHDRFPKNIVLYTAKKDSEIVGGIVVYVTPRVVHAQYSSATAWGKKNGAIDAIYDHIINHEYKDWPFFDFGRSTEDGGHVLNESLIFQKEGFGGRGVCYDTYEWEVRGDK